MTHSAPIAPVSPVPACYLRVQAEDSIYFWLGDAQGQIAVSEAQSSTLAAALGMETDRRETTNNLPAGHVFLRLSQAAINALWPVPAQAPVYRLAQFVVPTT